MRIERAEVFGLRWEFSPRMGPADAWGNAHAYCLVRVQDSDGVVGWGETYWRPAMPSLLAETLASLLGRPVEDARANWLAAWGAGEYPFATSAISIALDDLRARRLGVPVNVLYGGPLRSHVRAYAAFQGYIEGVDPAESWPADAAAARAQGFSAMKFRIGRYPIAHEVAILERLIDSGALDGVTLLSDASGAYTPRDAIRMGRELERLGFRWFEGPLLEWEGYVGYERLPAALDIPIAGAEVTLARDTLRAQLERGAFDIIQPDVVICGGIGEARFYADLARLHAVGCVPHTSGGAIGIAAALQLHALLPDPTRLSTTDPPLLEVGFGPNPLRTDVLADGWSVGPDGWVDIPDGPGLGVTVDEAFVRSNAVEHRVVAG